MAEGKVDMVLFGGSAGSLDVLLNVLPRIKKDIGFPLVLVIHRKYSETSTLRSLLAARTSFEVREPEDKEEIKAGIIYLAPADYHLLVEEERTFSLDYSEKVNFSRPSIDVTFESAAEVYQKHLVAILLSGANADGVEGLKLVRELGGYAIAQDPKTAQTPYMPEHAVKFAGVNEIQTEEEMVAFINSL